MGLKSSRAVNKSVGNEKPVSVANGSDTYECFIGFTTQPTGANPENWAIAKRTAKNANKPPA